MSFARPLRSLVAPSSRSTLPAPRPSTSSAPLRALASAAPRQASTDAHPSAVRRRDSTASAADQQLAGIFGSRGTEPSALEDPAAGERMLSRMRSEEGPEPARPGYAVGELPPREDPVLSLLTNLLMKHGKKEPARKVVLEVLNEIHRTTHRPPLPLLHEAISAVSPSLRIITLRRSSKVVHVPSALTERQSARQAVMWILKAAERGRGGATRGRRIAREVMAVLDGSGGALQRLEEVHKQGAANRSNLNGPR